jgi:hypothetical protein
MIRFVRGLYNMSSPRRPFNPGTALLPITIAETRMLLGDLRHVDYETYCAANLLAGSYN